MEDSAVLNNIAFLFRKKKTLQRKNLKL